MASIQQPYGRCGFLHPRNIYQYGTPAINQHHHLAPHLWACWVPMHHAKHYPKTTDALLTGSNDAGVGQTMFDLVSKVTAVPLASGSNEWLTRQRGSFQGGVVLNGAGGAGSTQGLYHGQSWKRRLLNNFVSMLIVQPASIGAHESVETP